jgi:predicted acylesterase/phospholipase RssA
MGEEPRIGLALSGGGFRASLFHLGVIRRLEELGIMEKVSLVSAVSGGSIIAAFYLCEMEKCLREDRIASHGGTPTPDRVKHFEKIAGRFLEAVDHNLRTRALVFTLRFHPWLFLKTLWLRTFRAGARAELIQAEYDHWFFKKDTLDQLPVEKPKEPKEGELQHSSECVARQPEPFYGPRLLLNTTSLLTGERIPFFRDTSSGIKDLKTPDKNVLLLSRVVGASSGVPVLFPPTPICGDLLVDGGVSDNQGIEGLLDECDVILVSDASGQLEVKHTLSRSASAVYLRVNEIFQFQIRNKLLELLMEWGKPNKGRAFAFIHLLVNLKSRRGSPPRVSTDILPALGRIRTDLDQFSLVEREALMYHGYTLIDAQLREYCCDFLKTCCPRLNRQKLKTPPLFQVRVQEKEDFRKMIRRDLEVGSEGFYLLRCLKKYRWPTVSVFLSGLAALGGLVWYIFGPLRFLVDIVKSALKGVLYGIVPQVLVTWLDRPLRFFGFQALRPTIDDLAHLLAVLILIGMAAYVVSYPVYVVVRRIAMWLDMRTYRKMTGGKGPTVHWDEASEETEAPS